MPGASKRRQVIQAFVDRLAQARRTNGFETDIGQLVLLGKLQVLGADDPAEACALVPGQESPTWQLEKLFIALPIEVQALVKQGADAQLTLESGIADVKRAIELEDRTLGGLLELQKPIERGPVRVVAAPSGSGTLGLGVTYTVRFTEGWGRP